MTTDTFARRSARPIVESIPGGRVRDVIAIGTYAALIGLSAQLVIQLPFTPVPVTGQTFAVLAGALALGLARGVAGGLLYLLVGVLGVPWLAGAHGGPSSLSLPTFGYVVGFVVAAAVVGSLADRGWSQRPVLAFVAAAMGNLAIYAVGATWLGLSLHVSEATAIELGVIPFLIGDGLKVVAAATGLSAAQRFADHPEAH